MDEILIAYDLPKWNQSATNNLNKSIKNDEIEALIKKFP